MEKSRTRKSITNTAVSFVSQLVIILLGFISRRVLIYSVGVQYLGINGLMSNILTIFSLAESGIGVAIGYSLYKPLAQKDIETVKALMRFYRTVYRALALMTLVVGLLFYPFLPIFLKDNSAPDANIIYFMFLASSVCSYLWSYKITLNSSDQNKYLYTIANTITQIAVLIAKVVILYFTQNYIIYLSVELGSTLIKNLVFSSVLDKRYPFLKEKNVRKLSDDEKGELSKNIKSLFWGKFGYIASQCSDNLVISSIISVTTLGLYSNYTTIVSSVSGFVTTFTSGVTASMGNLIASESRQRAYEVYKRIDFINYWLYTVTAICLLCLTEPFIEIWIGQDYILPKEILIVSVLLFYLKGINSGIDVAKNASGLYYPDRFIPLIEALLNLVISIVLAYQIGLFGVLLGTLISFLVLSFWTKPYFVFRDVFEVNFIEYLKWIGYKVSVSVAIGAILYMIQSMVSLENKYIELLLRALITALASNLLLCVVFFKTSEFEYIKSMIKLLVMRLKK